jgi:hypothetical protein
MEIRCSKHIDREMDGVKWGQIQGKKSDTVKVLWNTCTLLGRRGSITKLQNILNHEHTVFLLF